MRLLLPLVLLAGCASPSLQPVSQPDAALPVETQPEPPAETLDPTPPPPPPRSARTVEQFDTTTAEDRAEALAAPKPPAERSLGKTVASLGSPTEPGIWIKTPLVTKLTMGRAETASGKSIAVELRPSGGDAGSGSQISLAAMRLLELSLTDLPELTLFGAPS